MQLSNPSRAIPAECAAKVVSESSIAAAPQLSCLCCPYTCLLLTGDKDERNLVCSGGDNAASGASGGYV